MSSEKSVNSLIDDLAGELEPVQPLRHPALRALPWIGLSVAYVTCVVFALGVRPDLVHKAADPVFIFDVSLAAFISLSAAFVSAWWAVPDARGAKWIVSIPLVSTVAFILWNAIRFIVEEEARMPELHWDKCFGQSALLALLPLATILYLSRKGATCCSKTMCGMNILAVTGLAYIGLRFTCTIDTVGHKGILSMLPFIALGALMGFASRKIYKW